MVDENAPLKHTRLINKKTLFTLGAVVVGLLVFLLPDQKVLLGHLDDSKEPEIAIAFLEALEEQDEADIPVQLSLAINYNKAGRYQDAINAITPFNKFQDEITQWQAKRIYADSSIKLISQTTESQPDLHQELRKDLILFINQLHSIPSADLSRLFADIALQIGEPVTALAILKQYKDSDITSYEELINLALQSNNVDYAIELQEIEYKLNTNVESLSELLSLYLIQSEWDKGKAEILLFDKGQELTEQYYSTSINFLLAGGRLGLASSLALTKSELFETENNYEHASRLFAQKGDIDKAASLLEKAISYNNKQAYLVTLHQYNRWLGDPESALEITHRLEQFNLNEKQLRSGIEEASAVSNLASLSHFYHQLGQKGLLLVNEYDLWLDNAEKAIGAHKVITQLEEILSDAKESSPLLQKLVKFYHSVGSYEEVGNVWDSIASKTPLSFKDVNYYADAYKKMWQPEKSLAVLTSVKDIEKADDDYFEKVSSLAWYVSDKSALKRIQKLQKIENIDPSKFINAHSPIEMADSELFYNFYKKTGNLNVLEVFADQAIKEKDETKFLEAMNLVQLYQGTLPNSFLILKAQFAIKHKLFDEASSYLEGMLASNDSDESAIESLIWLNIERKDTQTLEEIYQKYKSTLADSPQLWSAFAAASNMLGRYEDAKIWYIQKINNDKNIPAELLDLANVLERLDDSFSANIIRKHVASHLTKELFKLPNGDRTYRSLASIFIGESIASSMVEAALKDDPSKEKAHELLYYYIGQENHEKARFLLKSSWLKNYDLPDSAELQLALLERNPSRVLELVKISLFLTPGERLAALNNIGEKKLAWEVGIQAIEKEDKTTEYPLLLSGLSSIHQERVYALRFQHKSFSQWDLTQNELGYYQPLGNGYVRLFARDIDSGPQQLLTRDISFDVQQLEGKYGFSVDSLQSEITALLDNRFSKTTLGIEVEAVYKFSKYVSLAAGASKNMDATTSRNMMMFGKKDAISATVYLNPTYRETISAQVSYQKYKSLFGEDIANNLSVSVKAQEAYFL
ncbi:tetratricopeptide repeat protein [Pseudocolwellia sp. HL-MZ19]|uniref:tetratricopeptide repeat protein n=1 Tax=Pseudocolwellia sp. HL-MZ19 TaxID=3400846 RepID=UPI003CFB286B